MWSGTAQAALDAGEGVLMSSLFYVTARRRQDNATVAQAVWSGCEPISLGIEGETRTYQPLGDDLKIADTVVSEGLLVASNSLSIQGLGPFVRDLQRNYDLTQAPCDAHLLLETAGLQLLGARRLFRGTIDGDPFRLSRGSAVLTLNVVADTRRGTRTIAALRDETRDPFFRYAHEKVGDLWG